MQGISANASKAFPLPKARAVAEAVCGAPAQLQAATAERGEAQRDDRDNDLNSASEWEVRSLPLHVSDKSSCTHKQISAVLLCHPIWNLQQEQKMPQLHLQQTAFQLLLSRLSSGGTPCIDWGVHTQQYRVLRRVWQILCIVQSDDWRSAIRQLIERANNVDATPSTWCLQHPQSPLASFLSAW